MFIVDGGYKQVISHKAPDEASKGLCSQGTTSMDLVDSCVFPRRL